jgi:hypothetical protein
MLCTMYNPVIPDGWQLSGVCYFWNFRSLYFKTYEKVSSRMNDHKTCGICKIDHRFIVESCSCSEGLLITILVYRIKCMNANLILERYQISQTDLS